MSYQIIPVVTVPSSDGLRVKFEPAITLTDATCDSFFHSQNFTKKQMKAIRRSIDVPTAQGMTKRQVIKHLIEGDRILGNLDLTFKSKFLRFLERSHDLLNGVWSIESNCDDVKLFFKHYQNESWCGDWLDATGLLVTSYQSYRISYLNAPVVLIHYHMVIDTKGVNRHTIDINKYELQSRNTIELFDFIQNIGGSGGVAIEFLKAQMTKLYPDVIYTELIDRATLPSDDTEFRLLCERVLKHLDCYPALLSNFQMTKKFANPRLDTIVYHNPPTASSQMASEFCSMVIVGGRRELVDNHFKYYFLAQNWTEYKCFVEFSAEYIQACGGTISMIKVKILEYPADLPLHKTIVNCFESAIDDKEIEGF